MKIHRNLTDFLVVVRFDSGVAMVGLSAEQAALEFPTDFGHVTVNYNDTIKACVQPRQDDEHLKLIFQLSTGRKRIPNAIFQSQNLNTFSSC